MHKSVEGNHEKNLLYVRYDKFDIFVNIWIEYRILLFTTMTWRDV